MITKEEESKFVDIATEIIFQRFFFFFFLSQHIFSPYIQVYNYKHTRGLQSFILISSRWKTF